MKKLFLMILAITIIVGCQKKDATTPQQDDNNLKKGGKVCVDEDEAGDYECWDFTHDLIAGQNEIVGEVQVTYDGETICVYYSLFEGSTWDLTDSHVFVGSAEEFNDFGLNKKCNPPFGQWNYNDEIVIAEGGQSAEGCWEYDAEGANFIVAVHGVVEGNNCADYAGLEASLPDQIGLQVTYHFGGTAGQMSYFWYSTLSDCPEGIEPNWMDGDYEGWCMNPAININPSPRCYLVDVYSSYEPLPELGINEANLDLVNYLINQHWVGQSSALGAYTYGDVQLAIWTLLEVQNLGPGEDDIALGPWLAGRVNAIVADAEANGEGYMPGCDDLVVIILAPAAPAVFQPNFVYVPMPCGNCGDETVVMWGTNEFPGNRWGWFQWMMEDTECLDYDFPGE